MINSSPFENDYNLVAEHPLRMTQLLLIKKVILPSLPLEEINKAVLLPIVKTPIDRLLIMVEELKEDMQEDAIKLARMFDAYKDYYIELLMCEENVTKTAEYIDFKGKPHMELMYHLKSLTVEEIFDITYNIDKGLFKSQLNFDSIINIEEVEDILASKLGIDDLETELAMTILSDELEHTLSEDYLSNEQFKEDEEGRTRTEAMNIVMAWVLEIDTANEEQMKNIFADKYEFVASKYN